MGSWFGFSNRGYGGTFNPPVTVNSFVGGNMNAGGGTAFSYENYPNFKNRVRESRGFTDPASLGADVLLNAQGWPLVDFACFLWEGQTIPSWLTTGTFKCGFISTNNTETIAGLFGGNTVSNIVRNGIGSYTTFDMAFTGQGGFKVTGTGGATISVYAYLPGYDMGAVDNPLLSTAWTNEAIALWSQFRHIRVMKAVGVEMNNRLTTHANRNSASTTQCAKLGVGASVVGLASAPLSGATSATLSAPWPLVSDKFAIPFHSSDLVQGRVCDMVAGNAAFSWSASEPLTSNVDSTGLAHVGMDGYPYEWWISLAKACGVGLWMCRPTLEDGTDYGPGTWSQGFLNYAAANWNVPQELLIEDVNENWNYGTYQSPWAFAGIAKVKGYWAASGNDATSYYAFRAHQFANLARATLPSLWGNTVKQVLCYQTNTGGVFYSKRIMAATAALNSGVVKTDIHYHATAPYLTPTDFVNSDPVPTLLTKVQNRANVAHLLAWTENNVILAAFWGIPYVSYEDDGYWGGGQFAGVTNLYSMVLDPGILAPLQTHIQLGFDCGKAFLTHFSLPVSAGASTAAGIGYELTNIYAYPLDTYQLRALQSFYSGFTYTRNVVSASGSIISGVNYADNSAAISAVPGSFNLANSFNFMPFGQTGRLPYRINCTDPRANSGPVSYTVNCTWANITGSPTTDINSGNPTDGNTLVASGVSVPANGVQNMGTITLRKGINYIVWGRSGGQGTSAQNQLTQMQFV